jgi:hypothetical protein
MKHLKYLALLSTFALLFSFNAFAKDKNQRSVDIPDSVNIAGTQLAPGNYKVNWQGAGPAVHVNFLKNGKVVASAPATLRTNDSKVTQDDVITDATGAKAKTLKEIDFSHQKEALLFNQSGM